MTTKSEPVLAGYWPGRWPGEDGGPRRTQAPPQGAGLALQPGEKLAVRSRMTTFTTIARVSVE
ncbi:MAG TPA: hypothetical protein VMR52_13890 [Dehalococcoidia bacterium]|nr:hypothetical protein [Dehalococcoidia bacterium]